jgi:hypothetical protein
MLSVIVLSVIMLNVVMLSVIMLVQCLEVRQEPKWWSGPSLKWTFVEADLCRVFFVEVTIMPNIFVGLS